MNDHQPKHYSSHTRYNHLILGENSERSFRLHAKYFSNRVHLTVLFIREHDPSLHCKQVEINNSDAEGRLVLSDAVAHATRHYSDDCNLVVDMATLTGAQLISTGKMHAAILANTEELEQRAVKAGLASGDLCYPLLYAPDLLKEEFNSKVR